MGKTAIVSSLLLCLGTMGLSFPAAVSKDVPLSTRTASSFGFLCVPLSVGVRGDVGMVAVQARFMSRSWAATAVRGLSASLDGGGLLRGGVWAARMASAVFSSGTGGGWSRLRLGDGWASCVGMAPVDGRPSYMRTVAMGVVGAIRRVGRAAGKRRNVDCP